MKAAVLAACVLIVACSSPGAAVRQDIESLAVATVPDGTRPVDLSIAHSTNRIDAVWTFTPAMSWSNYKAWLTARLDGNYTPRPARGDEIAFGRVLPGDAYRLVLAPTPDGKVRATFRAEPF